MMDGHQTVELVGVLLTVLLMIASGVWAVANIRSTTAVLRTSIDSLTKSIDKLDERLEHLDNKIDDHSERITRLEERRDTVRTGHGGQHGS